MNPHLSEALNLQAWEDEAEASGEGSSGHQAEHREHRGEDRL
jgi:hypothetical protein